MSLIPSILQVQPLCHVWWRKVSPVMFSHITTDMLTLLPIHLFTVFSNSKKVINSHMLGVLQIKMATTTSNETIVETDHIVSK